MEEEWDREAWERESWDWIPEVDLAGWEPPRVPWFKVRAVQTVRFRELEAEDDVPMGSS